MSQVLVKICGITRYEDAKLAVELGAWALGFIFYSKSPRYIKPEAAKELIERLKKADRLPAKLVGVFVNADANEVAAIRKDVGLTTVQLHGEEAPEYCEALVPGVFKALRLESPEDLNKLKRYAQADFLLLDAAVAGAYGGTGQLSDWQLAKQAAASYPVILSGGLTPENLALAIQVVKPAAIDLASGVEASPGIKSHDKLRALFSALKMGEDSYGHDS